MAGGTLVVTAAGAALGAHQGAIVSNAYLGQIEDFRITKLQDGRGPAVVVIDGFLTQRRNSGSDWRAGLTASHPDNPWYHVAWESKRLYEIGTALASNSAATFLAKGVELARRGTRKTPRFLPAVVLASLLARNPWHTAMVRASMTGVLLADLLARTRQPSGFTLIGHSLDARVIYYALAALQTKQRRIVRDAHLLGGAVGCGDAKEWHALTSAVSGHVFNYFSEKDAVLKVAYRAASGLTSTPIGIQPIGAASEQIIDVDVSSLALEHTAYKKRLSEILEAGVQRIEAGGKLEDLAT